MIKEKGLTKKEAEDNLKIYGLNEIKDVSKTTPLIILLRQIKNNFIIYLLLLSVILSFFVGKSATAYVILLIIIAVIFVGFIQEYKSEKAISSLKNLLVPISIVIREGKEQEILSKNIVPEDILILRNGDKIPADCLLLEQNELLVNESILTGESKEVTKEVSSSKKYTDINLLFMGAHIVNGKCVAKVIHTGMNTKFGKIAKLISSTEKEFPLHRKVNKIVKVMVVLSVIMSVLTGLIIILRSPLLDKVLFIDILILVIALSVSAFPEGFPVVLITTLATGANNMAKKNAIVNRMSIIETLGETTIVCSDKTGTITKGEMTVKKIFSNNKIYEVSGTGYDGAGDIICNKKKININNDICLKHLLYCSLLCNDSIIERTGFDLEFKTIGSSTESALLILGVKAKLFKEDIEHDRLEEIPFNSERKMMSVLCSLNKNKIVYSKGALEYIIKKCKFIQKDNKIIKLTKLEINKILDFNKNMTSKSLRTIAFAYKKVNNISKNNLEEDLVFLGFAGIEDPARPEVKDSIKQCYQAGVKVKMITGDNKETAISIANDIGLIGKTMCGYEIDNLSDEELLDVIDTISIFARVRPEHKLRIVKALKLRGEIVTMTGDGVNDAPALKEAHIGIAMGKNGTDVSRSVADMTLKDDNFSTIVSAIREGRTIFKNIRKFATYQLSCNLTELFVLFIGVLLSPLFGWQIPLLLTLQILFMNLVTDNLPAITLGLNSYSKESMNEPPRKNSNIINKKLLYILLFTAIVLTIMTLGAYFLMFNIIGATHQYSQTTALLTLIGLEIVAAFHFRSFRKGVLNRSLMVNKYLFYASIISLVATIIIVYTPLNKVFGTIPIGFKGLLIVIIMSALFVIIFDILKYINNKNKFVDVNNL
jgi:P-type Ca2+ transporter type 2C